MQPPVSDRGFFYGFRMHFEKYSDLYQDGIILALTINYFASELMQNRFPSWLTSASYTALEFVGVVGLNYQISLLSKHCGDAHVARKGKDRLMFASSVIKCTYVASGIGLTGSGIAAAIFRQAGRLNVTNGIYKVTRPWGLGLIGIGVAKTIFNLAIDRQLLRQSENGLDFDECYAIKKIVGNDALKVQQIAYTLPGAKMGIRIRCQMDKDTLRTTRKVLHDADEEETLDVVQEVAIKNIETQYKVTWAHLGLKVFGDILMGVSAMKPGTLADASSRLFASTVYTVVMVWRKVKQHFQRATARTLESDDIPLRVDLNGPEWTRVDPN